MFGFIFSSLLLTGCSLDLYLTKSSSENNLIPVVPVAGDFSFSTKLSDATLPTDIRTEDIGGRLGHSVAISEDQSTMVVGAPLDSTDAAGINAAYQAGAAYVYIKSAGNWVLQQKIIATGTNSRAMHDNFGTSVAISGDTIVIGAVYHGYDATGANFLSTAGAAFVFKRSAGVWSQQQKLSGEGTNARLKWDWFGASVAISGDTIVVGAPYHDADAAGNLIAIKYDFGAAFIYKRSGVVWSLEQKIIEEGAGGSITGDKFGDSVAIEGDNIVVGATGNYLDANGANTAFNAGAVYVYTRSASVWTFQQKIVATGVNARKQDDHFGKSVSISGDTIVVGSPDHEYEASGTFTQQNRGAAFVYVRSAGVWSQQQKLSAKNGLGGWEFSHFGTSVGVSGDSIIVGSPNDPLDATESVLGTSTGSAYTYTRAAGVWSQEQKIVATGLNGRNDGDTFGIGVAIQGDIVGIGSEIHQFDEAGANPVTEAGAIFIHERAASVWSLVQKRVANNPLGLRGASTAAEFGRSVAISADETTMIIGAPFDDLDATGGAPLSDSGAAYVYIKSAGNWVLQQKLVGSGVNGRVDSDKFGEKVAISGDTVVIGVPSQDYNQNGASSRNSAGAVYVFTRAAGVWSLQQKLVADAAGGRAFSDRFGQSIGIQDDTLVVGAPEQDDDSVQGNDTKSESGAAYVFTRAAGVWTLQQKVIGTGVNGRVADDLFGTSVAISGESIAIGAPGQDTNAAGVNSGEDGTGAVFIFTRTAGVWNLEQKLIASGTNGRVDYDAFGSSIAMDGDTIVASAEWQGYDENGANYFEGAGASYVFTRSAGVWSFQQKLAAMGTNSRTEYSEFGKDISISGDVIVAGSMWEFYDQDGANPVPWAGAAYIFTRDSGAWTLDKKLVGTGTNGRNSDDGFGTGVAVRGSSIAIGAYGQGYNASGTGLSAGAGAVFVYEK